MPYPTVRKSEARTYLLNLGDKENIKPLPEVHSCAEGPEVDWEVLGEKIAADLLSLLEEHRNDKGVVDGGEFEVAASLKLHSLLYDNHPALADGEFWIWLAVYHGQEVVDRRYPGKRNLQNFGIGGLGENLLYRLWMRAEISYSPDKSDRYQLARVGDIDFWRSHIFRQGYGEVRAFARALIEFQFPQEKKGKPRLKIDEIRALAKRLKRARSNLLFEVMNESSALQFIDAEWSRLKAAS